MDNDDVLIATSQSVGAVILRPRTESLTTLTSRMPERFARDLLIHTDTLFSDSVRKSHAESEKRRQAKPLVAQNPAPASPTTKRSLMSFMQEDKWGVNSVMGVFQRQPASQAQATASSSPNHANTTDRSSSSSSSSSARPKRVSAITQDSPPLVAQKDQEPKPEPEIVFDLKDHVTKKKNEANGDPAESKDQHDVKKEDDLDPFFADEED